MDCIGVHLGSLIHEFTQSQNFWVMNPITLGAHNSNWINFKWKILVLVKSFQQHIGHFKTKEFDPLVTCLNQSIMSQVTNLIIEFFKLPQLVFRSSNCKCNINLNIYISRTFWRCKKNIAWTRFDPPNLCIPKFWDNLGSSTPKWEFDHECWDS